MPLDWNTGLVKHLGIRFVETEKDRIVAELEVRPELLTVTGTLHGGTLMAFADTIGAAFTQATGDPFTGTPTYLLFNPARQLVAAKSGDVTLDALERSISQERP